jgi:hypothetical protein
MEETPLEAIPRLSPTKRQINKRFIYLVLAVLGVIIIFLAYKTFGTNKTAINQKPAIVSPTQELTQTPAPSESPSPSSAPTITPVPSANPVDSTTGLDRSKLSVTIENGSGEAGVAGKGSDYLKGLGYAVSTDNADNFNYVNVTIQVKAAKSDFLPLLKKDLGANYTINSATSDLPDSFSSDALVIIGK